VADSSIYIDVVRAGLVEAADALNDLIANEFALESISKAGGMLVQTIRSGGRIYSCGNGGSMCDAMHFAEELSGRFRADRPAYPAMAISDPGHLSCVGNDYGYDQVFARFLQAQGRTGDVLLAISTSGSSKNVLAAVHAARQLGVRVIGLTGKSTSILAQTSDIAIVTSGGRYADRVQELHIKVIHLLIELVERQLAPQNYTD
jgi:D-sedoheptulose 7-phosphate isomerase